ncbi:hypothetical protein JCM37172_14530 [Faecalimonas hominis]
MFGDFVYRIYYDVRGLGEKKIKNIKAVGRCSNGLFLTILNLVETKRKIWHYKKRRIKSCAN